MNTQAMKNTFLIKSILCAGLLFTGILATAQQDPNYIFYRYSMNLINPAFAGAHEAIEGKNNRKNVELGLNLRSQWLGVDGAPETKSIFFGTGLGKNLGIGISVINDQTFIENQTFAGIDLSYRVTLSEKSNLYLGIKAGANSYDVNTAGLSSFGINTDPSITNLEGNFTPNIGAGAYLKGESYFLTFSIPKILTPARIEQSSGIAQLGRNAIHMYLSGGYKIELDRGVFFKPSVMARYVNASPLSIDLTGLIAFNDTLDIGANYRINESLSALAVVSVFNWLDFGYAYELSAESAISSSGSMGSHELFMRLEI